MTIPPVTTPPVTIPSVTIPPVTAPSARTGRVRTAARRPAALTVVYDGSCEFCRRCRTWLASQPTWIPLSFVAADDPAAAGALRGLPVGEELVVISDAGEVWVGARAFIMCLWATRAHRHWSYRLTGPALEPLARRFFAAVSSNRGTISALLAADECADGTCASPARAAPANPWAAR